MFIQLTKITRLLTEEAQKRVDAFPVKKKFDEDGHDADWYIDMGIPVPKDLIEDENDRGVEVELTDKDYTTEYTKVLCNYENVLYFNELPEEEGCFALYDTTFAIQFKENTEEIYKLIKKERKNG